MIIRDFNKAAIITHDGEVSYRQLMGNILSYADMMPKAEQFSLAEGEKMKTLILSENRSEWIYAFFAVWHNEAIAVPVDATSTVHDVAYIMNDCRPQCIFTSREKEQLARDAMREAGVKVDLGDLDAVDIVGTGGDGHHTFNISTAAAFVAAGAGVTVAKHGNVAATSRCGAADVLKALGYDLTLTPETVARCVREVGIGFLFARELHPAMRYAAPVRKALGCKTIFNLLGPLTNPAGVRRHALGVYDPKLAPLFAQTLRDLGSERALVFSGEDGLDEISPSGFTFVTELRDGQISSRLLSGAELCGGTFTTDDLAGGTPEENARQMRGVLSGRIGGAKRAATVLNAAAAIYVAGRAESLVEAVKLAQASVDSGAALEKLERMVKFA